VNEIESTTLDANQRTRCPRAIAACDGIPGFCRGEVETERFVELVKIVV
jgi:hypothetical protein